MKSLALSLIGLVSFAPFCFVFTSGAEAEGAANSSCEAPVDISAQIKPALNCLKPGIWRDEKEARKRDLALGIPCNKVTWIDQNTDVFGEGDRDDAATIRSSTFFRTFKWLGESDRFNLTASEDPFTAEEAAAGTPILTGILPQTVHSLIENARSTIFLDMFLFGGSWGLEVSRDLIRAAERGVHVVVLHDTESMFAVGNEIVPLWDKLIEHSKVDPNLTVLASNTSPPHRVSSVPFGLQGLFGQLAKMNKASVSGEGRSDHSKILIIDAIYDQDKSEYLDALEPKALVTSRNMVDSAGSYYYDESVIIEGPAAVAAMLHFRSDLYWAWEQAMKKSKSSYNEDDSNLLGSWLNRLQALEQGPLLVKARGMTAVEAVQVSANDEVRNLDSGIIRRLAEAKTSIDLYGKISYSWEMAIALKEAMARGVQVRMILDQQTPTGALLNASLPYMMTQAPRRLANGKTTVELLDATGHVIKEEDIPVRWHLSFRPGYFFPSSKTDRTPLAQEIHAKTIIVDGRYTLFGSTNFDTLTFAGGFREYSVWVDDPSIAEKASLVFDRMYHHPLLTVSHKVWLGKAPVPAEAQAFMDELRQERSEESCPQKEAICDPRSVLQGGSEYEKEKLKRDLIKNVLSQEEKRIRSVGVDAFTIDEQGDVICSLRDESQYR